MLKDIVEKEMKRETAADCRMIHLRVEGKFLRAYCVSAWLVKRFMNDKYKISNREYKGQKGTVPMLGFPPESLDKMLAEDKCKDFGKIKQSDTEIDIIIPPEVIPDEYPADLFMEDYGEWLKGLPKDKPSVDAMTGTENIPRQVTATGILQKILAYPVENKTPLECQSFLFEIRRETAVLF